MTQASIFITHCMLWNTLPGPHKTCPRAAGRGLKTPAIEVSNRNFWTTCIYLETSVIRCCTIIFSFSWDISRNYYYKSIVTVRPILCLFRNPLMRKDVIIVRPRCVRSKRKQLPSLMSLHSGRSLGKRTSACIIRLQWVRWVPRIFPVHIHVLWSEVLSSLR